MVFERAQRKPKHGESSKKFCAERLEPFKAPVKTGFVDGGLTSDRVKRVRIGRDARQPGAT
jgi:hypothetical protein